MARRHGGTRLDGRARVASAPMLAKADAPGMLSPMDESEPTPRPAFQLRPARDIASLRESWSELAERGGNLFSTWEWADCWLRHYGTGREVLPLVCAEPDGRTTAILPLCIERHGPLRVARFVGHGAADESGPVCAPAHRIRALEALAAAPGRWSVMLAERLVADHGWTPPAGARTLRHEASPVVDATGLGWDDYLATRSANFRSQVRRKERRLLREHGLVYRLADDPDRLDGDMDVLFALHGRRWGGAGAFDPLRQAFHRDFARVALTRGWLRLWLAEVNGTPVAAWYGFRYGGSEWYYQSGRDPDWERSSVGLVLVAHSLRSAIEDGVSYYRLLRGGESYKDRFATGDVGVATVAVPATAGGRVATVAAAAGIGLPGALGRRFRRLADS
jgi:CelD/BcsL family acetyltransferase involved in cellulose biosynthesis